MDYLKKHALLTIAVVTVFMGCWLIGNVMYLLPRATERTAHTEFEFEEEGGRTGQSGFMLYGDSWRYIYFGTIIFLVSTAAISYFKYGTKRGTVLQMASILTIILISIFYLSSLGMISSIPSPVSDSLGDGILSGGDSGVSQIVSENKGILILGVLSSSFLIVAAAVKLKEFIIPEKSQEEDDYETELTSTVDEAIRSLYQGKDVRSTVIRCYQNMCYVLEDEGVSNDEFMTPRELKSKTVDELNINEGTISSLTELFEKGRYSVHELDKNDRKRALRNLQKLKGELGEGGGEDEQ
ncbi:MAG: DUF4129 domain-containing protein [Candidatus Saliniplasma sp.]